MGWMIGIDKPFSARQVEPAMEEIGATVSFQIFSRSSPGRALRRIQAVERTTKYTKTKAEMRSLADAPVSPDGDRTESLLGFFAASGSLRCFFRVFRVFRGSTESLAKPGFQVHAVCGIGPDAVTGRRQVELGSSTLHPCPTAALAYDGPAL